MDNCHHVHGPPAPRESNRDPVPYGKVEPLPETYDSGVPSQIDSKEPASTSSDIWGSMSMKEGCSATYQRSYCGTATAVRSDVSCQVVQGCRSLACVLDQLQLKLRSLARAECLVSAGAMLAC